MALSLLTLAVAAVAVSASAPPPPPSSSHLIHPSLQSAAERGPLVFNAVYDALRKRGAVVHRNGMSLFLATVPEGVLLHHGNARNATPTSLDWLAYEIEHSEMFARPRFSHPGDGPGGGPGDGGHGPPGEPGGEPGRPGPPPPRAEPAAPVPGNAQVVFVDAVAADEPEAPSNFGWLHTYRTLRPLQFLYIDGMSGDKDSSGVIDSQDYLLRAGLRNTTTSTITTVLTVPKRTEGDDKDGQEPRPPGPPSEFQRALDLCAMCSEWGLHGVIRTETPGTEIIKCNFFDGLEQVQSLRRPAGPGWPEHPGGGPGKRPDEPGKRPGRPGGPGGGPGGPGFGYIGPEDAFRDVGSGRTLLDYSSMVSALFFPVNLSNPDPKERAPRLINAAAEDMVAVREYLARVVATRRMPLHQASSPFRGEHPPPPQHGGHLPPPPHGEHPPPPSWPSPSIQWRDVADLIVRRYASTLVALAAGQDATVDALRRRLHQILDVFVDYAVADETERAAEAQQRCTTFYLQTTQPRVSAAAGGTEADRLIYTAFEAVNAKICTALFAIQALDGRNETVLAGAQSAAKQLVTELDWSVFPESQSA